MDTSKAHLAAAAGVGAVLPYVSDLINLLHLPAPVANALCAAIVAVAYALVPKQASAKGGQAGYSRTGLLAVLALMGVWVVACATLGGKAPKLPKEPAVLTRTVYKDAQLACLACVAPPAELEDACAQLKPICDGLAGVCSEADAGK